MKRARRRKDAVTYRAIPFPALTHKSLTLSEDEFLAVTSAKRSLVALIGFEQKFDLLLHNYAEFERDLLGLGVDVATFKRDDYGAFRERSQLLTRRVVNFLTTARLYLDQLDHDLSALYGRTSGIRALAKARRAHAYDTRLGYRVMEELRNHVQHCNLPLHSVGYEGALEELPRRWRYMTIPRIDTTILGADAGFKRKVLEELTARDKDPTVTRYLREYMEGIASIHEFLRHEMDRDATAWESALASLQTRANRRFQAEPTTAIRVRSFSPGGSPLSDEHVFRELWTYRRELAMRNSGFGNLASRYVSGAVEQ